MEALTRVTSIEKSDDVFMNLDKRLQKAVNLFTRHKRLSALDYMTLSGLGRTLAVTDLNKLAHLGLIQRVGGGRSTVYRLKDEM